MRYKLRWSPMPGTASGTQLSFSSSRWGVGRGVYSLVCLILNLPCSLWSGDWGQAAWPTRPGQDLTPCVHVLSLSCDFLSPVFLLPRAPPEAQGSHFYHVGQNVVPSQAAQGLAPRARGYQRGTQKSKPPSPRSAPPDTWTPSGEAGLNGAQRTVPAVSARTCPPAKGRTRCSLSAGQLNKALRGQWFCPPRNDPCSGLCLGK